MGTDHDYFMLPHRAVRDVVLYATPQENKTYELSICDSGYNVKEKRSGLSRLQVILHFAAMGILPHFSKDHVHHLLKRASRWCDRIEAGSFPQVYGCYFEIFFHANGKWDLEFEPGMGTTVARMTFTTFDDACNALMGILHMLEPDERDGRPYLQRCTEELHS